MGQKRAQHGAQQMQPLLPLSIFTTCTSQSLLLSLYVSRSGPFLPPMCLLLTLNPSQAPEEGRGNWCGGAGLDSVPVVGWGMWMSWGGEGRCWNSFKSMCWGMGVPRVQPQPLPVGQVVGTLLGLEEIRAPCLSCRACGQTWLLQTLPKGWWGLEELQCWTRRKLDKENYPSNKKKKKGKL